MPTITSNENSEPGACGITQRPSAMNSNGKPTSSATIAADDAANCIGSPACNATNSTASASSSPAIALLVTQKRSSSSRPRRSSVSRMKPVEGVNRASASSAAACQPRSM